MATRHHPRWKSAARRIVAPVRDSLCEHADWFLRARRQSSGGDAAQGSERRHLLRPLQSTRSRVRRAHCLDSRNSAAGVKIVFLTPGTGSYYCGACMRDNMLARELIRVGHDVTIAPMYLPLMLDSERVEGLDQTPIFFGGINVFLQQKVSLFRKTPALFDKLLNSRGLLRWAARHSHLTSAREQGELTREMLRVDSGPMRKELDKLFEWLGAIAQPDLVCLSTTLLAGFTPEIKRRLGVPVIAF